MIWRVAEEERVVEAREVAGRKVGLGERVVVDSCEVSGVSAAMEVRRRGNVPERSSRVVRRVKPSAKGDGNVRATRTSVDKTSKGVQI